MRSPDGRTGRCHAGAVRIRWPVTVLAALTLGLGPTGCAGDDPCQGATYDEDLGQQGARSPIEALEAWLGGHEGLPAPPDADWIQEDSGRTTADEVVLTNEDGDGWWVIASRTSPGGWVVTQATDGAAACGDELT